MQKFRQKITNLWDFPWIFILIIPFILFYLFYTNWFVFQNIDFSQVKWIIWFSACFILLPLMLAWLTKIIFFKHRPNPEKDTARYRRMSTSTFPSMHTVATFSIFLLAALYFVDTSRFPLVFVYFVCSILVMISRVKLKKHYFLDIIGGIVYSVIWLILVLLILFM